MCAGNLAGDDRQGLVALPPPLDAIGKDDVRNGERDVRMVKTGGNRPNRAVAYVRMSTDHQRYSTENQLETIRRFGAARDIEIIRHLPTYIRQ